MTALRTITPNFRLNQCIELTQPEESFSIQGYDIHAFRVKHNVICYGYSVGIHRAGRFSVERAREQNVPMKLWSRLQKGETIEQDGVIYEPQMVLGPRKRSESDVLYRQPSMDTTLQRIGFIYLRRHVCRKEKLNKAKQYKHMTFYEAADMAKRAEVKRTVVDPFFSVSGKGGGLYTTGWDIFANAYLGKDGRVWN